MNKKINLQIGVLSLIVVAAAFSRMIPHLPNLSPIGAVGLFGAAHFAKRWQAVLIPLAAVWLSDLFLNNVVYAAYTEGFVWFYGGFQWQYISYILIAFFGMAVFSKKINAKNVLFGALGASLIFFLLSNFGVFMSGTMYPMNAAGLIACYTAAIPFAQATLMGNLVFGALLFGGYYLLQNKNEFFKLAHLTYSR